MAQITEKTIRTENVWVKITRDNKNRTFTFARGYVGEPVAHNIETMSFEWLPNWSEALISGNRMVSNYTY